MQPTIHEPAAHQPAHQPAAPVAAQAAAPRRGPVAVLWEVDGVFALQGEPRLPRHELLDVELAPGPTRLRREALQALGELGWDPHFKCHWMTTWDDGPDGIDAITDLAGAPSMSAYTRADSPVPAHWKLGIVTAIARTGARVAWIDAAIGHLLDETPGAPSAAELTTAWRDQILTIAPDPALGLHRGHLNTLHAFATA